MARSNYIYLVRDEHLGSIIGAFTVLREARGAVARYLLENGTRALAIRRMPDGGVGMRLDQAWTAVPLTEEA